MTEFWRGPALAKMMRAIHSYSSMLVLVLLLFFAITGITLNHPDLIISKAGQVSQQSELELPPYLQLAELPKSAAK